MQALRQCWRRRWRRGDYSALRQISSVGNEPDRNEVPSWKIRMRRFASEYGKVGLCTHAVLSALSFGVIFGCVENGISLGIEFEQYQVAGNLMVSYTIYKLASPIRWPLTFALTPIVVRKLRDRGYHV